ncbi:hypothetical protein GY45DRAFT_1338164 [Cubamyces sp. BRFM 1775]|nr:hypothetical protein GY45DRAFT_1338164 [Cubamyces sp. BRFM 1775]
MSAPSDVAVEVSERIAAITFNSPKTLNAVNLAVPFTFLGTSVEAYCSVTFRGRIVTAKANEVLIWPVPEFQAAVRKLILAELEDLNTDALLGMKRLMKAGLNEQHDLDAVNLRESYALGERFASAITSERLGKIARKELKHKLRTTFPSSLVAPRTMRDTMYSCSSILTTSFYYTPDCG